MRHVYLWVVSLGLSPRRPSQRRARHEGVRRAEVLDVPFDCGKGKSRRACSTTSGAQLSAAEIREWLVDPDSMRKKANAERKPAMKSFAKLSKEDLDGLVAYLQTLKTK